MVVMEGARKIKAALLGPDIGTLMAGETLAVPTNPGVGEDPSVPWEMKVKVREVYPRWTS